MKSIGFKPYLIEEIIEGNKFVTRRVMKRKPINHDQAIRDTGLKLPLPISDYNKFLSDMQKKGYTRLGTGGSMSGMLMESCRYGQVGDTIYVKETYAQVDGKYVYKLDNPDLKVKWVSGMFMPERAARIFLLLDQITPEYLHDITEEEAIIEGVKRVDDGFKDYLNDKNVYEKAVDSFKSLWIKIGGIDSWNENPPVYAIKFRASINIG